MNHSKLRELIQNWEKYPACVQVERAPLITPGFPGTFNLSFTEHPWLLNHGGFLNFTNNLIFSTIQSCIRPNDFSLINDPSFSWRYLGIFEMSDMMGAIDLSKKPDYEELQRQQIGSLINLLNYFGIALDRVYPSYCSGGYVRSLTEGKYQFDYCIPADNISKNAFLELGVPEENLRSNETRNTLLSLFVHQPTPWGYRCEVEINVGSKENLKFLDTATIEYLLWEPVFDGKEAPENIVGLREREDGASLAVVGLERLCMLINGLQKIQDVDYIKPIYDAFNKISKDENVLAIESLRALHRIYSDITHFDCELSRHHKKKIRRFLQNCLEPIILKLEPDSLRELLQIHTDTQPWHSELKEGIEPTLKRIEQYRQDRTK